MPPESQCLVSHCGRKPKVWGLDLQNIERQVSKVLGLLRGADEAIERDSGTQPCLVLPGPLGNEVGLLEVRGWPYGPVVGPH